MEIDGNKVCLHFHLGGDYKFLLVAMGMKGATSNDSCIWCLIHKKDRQATLLTFKTLPAIINNHFTMFHVYNYNKKNHCAFIPVGATCLWNITPTVHLFLCS